MKRIKCLISAAVLSLLFASCAQLQDSLSSEMQAKLNEETGTASIGAKVWYYNGTLSENMSEENGHTILVNFGKKVALNTLSGSIELNYTNAAGNAVKETFTQLKGTFTEDFTGYKVNLGDVMAFFDTVKIPGGTALMNLKLGGFVCAEGSQNGRPIAALDVKNIQIKPLFKTYTVDYSTAGFNNTSKIEMDVNGNVAVKDGPLTVTGYGSDSKNYNFKLTAEDKKIVLLPEFNTAPADGVKVTVILENIVSENSGTGLKKEIAINFSKYKIVVDGKFDANYLESGAVVHEDTKSDQNAFNGLYDVSGESDIEKVYITNDDDYLYVCVAGKLNVTWHNAISVLISNGTVKGGNGARANILAANTESYKTLSGTRTVIQPNIYITHQPGMNNNGDGAISAGAWVSSANKDITALIKAAPAGWTESTFGEYTEYAVPLAQTGLAKGQQLSIIVVASLHWDDGKNNAIHDAAKNDSVIYNDDAHNSVMYDFNNGIKYTVR